MSTRTTSNKPPGVLRGAAVATIADRGKLAGEVESLLDELLAQHEAWRGLQADQRNALRRADGDGVEDVVGRQSAVLQRIADLEERRRAVVKAACASGAVARADATGPVTLTQIAEALPEPGRGRLLDLAGRLKALLADIDSQNRMLKSATHTLVTHMEGLMRQVARTISHSGTYGRRGYVDSTPTVVSGMDVVQ
jgi:hypothetical protein